MGIPPGGAGEGVDETHAVPASPGGPADSEVVPTPQGKPDKVKQPDGLVPEDDADRPPEKKKTDTPSPFEEEKPSTDEPAPLPPTANEPVPAQQKIKPPPPDKSKAPGDDEAKASEPPVLQWPIRRSAAGDERKNTAVLTALRVSFSAPGPRASVHGVKIDSGVGRATLYDTKPAVSCRTSCSQLTVDYPVPSRLHGFLAEGFPEQ